MEAKEMVENSYRVVAKALELGGSSKAVAYSLEKLGKRITARAVRKQGEAPITNCTNWFGNYLRNVGAFYLAGQTMAGDYIERERAKFIRLIRGGCTLPDGLLDELLIIRQRVDLMMEA